MIFSDRLGITKPPLDLYLNSIPEPLKNRVWNLLQETYLSQNKNQAKDFCVHVAKNFRKSRADEIPAFPYDLKEWLKEYFFNLEWYEIYNFLEFMVSNPFRLKNSSVSSTPMPIDKLILKLNRFFEEEHSGYRFIGKFICPITHTEEINAVDDALRNLSAVNLTSAEEHINTALTLFSKRPDPDYRNAIKESISAIESVVKLLNQNKKLGLQDGLNELSKKIKIHKALSDGFVKLYGYTSDSDGIRHAMLEDSNAGFDEAKFMIVSCSAFSTYLLTKAGKANLLNRELSGT